MKSIFREYGMVIFVGVALIVLIAMTTPIGKNTRKEIDDVISQYANETEANLKTNNLGPSAINVDSKNGKVILTFKAKNKEDVFTCMYRASNSGKATNWKDINVKNNDKDRTIEILTDTAGVPSILKNGTKVEYKIYDSNKEVVAVGIVVVTG